MMKAKHLDSPPYLIHIHFKFGDKRRTDLTNKAESINDLLVDNGIIPDDEWKVLENVILSCEYEKDVWETEIYVYNIRRATA